MTKVQTIVTIGRMPSKPMDGFYLEKGERRVDVPCVLLRHLARHGVGVDISPHLHGSILPGLPPHFSEPVPEVLKIPFRKIGW